MAAVPEVYLARIREVAPQVHIREALLNQDGLANDVVLVNGELVFRFAKGEFGVKALAAERKVLAALRGRLPLQTPHFFYQDESMAAYARLDGEPLTRRVFTALDADDQQAIAYQMGSFLQALHSMRNPELPQTAAPVTLDRFRDQRQRARQKVYPLLLPHQRDWAEQVYAFIEIPGAFDYTPGLVHADLAPYHILFDAQTRRVNGVIDFGTAGLGDPASDIGTLLQNFGVDFVTGMAGPYPGLDSLLPRARFYAQAIEIQWVLLGLESGEPFWFTAHLGGERGY